VTSPIPAGRFHPERPPGRTLLPRVVGLVFVPDSKRSVAAPGRPAHHHALRPGPQQPRPPPQLHPRRLHGPPEPKNYKSGRAGLPMSARRCEASVCYGLMRRSLTWPPTSVRAASLGEVEHVRADSLRADSLGRARCTRARWKRIICAWQDQTVDALGDTCMSGWVRSGSSSCVVLC